MSSKIFLYQILLTIHLIGLALGLGGAAITDFTFFKALKLGDRITPETVSSLRTVSQVVWIGLGILAISGLGLFLLAPYIYITSIGFIAKMVFVAVIAINGIFLNFYSTARLTTFNFSEKYKWRGAAWRARKLSFVFGGISFTSWYAALIAAMFKKFLLLSFPEFMGIYILTICVAITGALILEKQLTAKFSASSSKVYADSIQQGGAKAGTTFTPVENPNPDSYTPNNEDQSGKNL